MEKEIAVGPEGKLDLKFENGKVIVSFVHVHASGQIKVEASEDAKYFLELLKNAEIPDWAKALVGAAEGALP